MQMAQFEYHFVGFKECLMRTLKNHVTTRRWARDNPIWSDKNLLEKKILLWFTNISHFDCCCHCTFLLYSVPWVNDNVQGFLIQESEKWTELEKINNEKLSETNTKKWKLCHSCDVFPLIKFSTFIYLPPLSHLLLNHSTVFFRIFLFFYSFCCS